MAQLLHLSKEEPGDHDVSREVKRRVWWSLYLIDRWASAGLGLPRHFHNGGPVPQLPMDEVMFSQLGVTDGSLNVEHRNNRQPGIWSHMIALVKIFGQIQDLNHELVDQIHWDENSIESRVLSLADQLATFECQPRPHDERRRVSASPVHSPAGSVLPPMERAPGWPPTCPPR